MLPMAFVPSLEVLSFGNLYKGESAFQGDLYH